MALTTIKTASLPDDSVTAAKIASGAVTTAKIADDGVTEAKVANDAIGLPEIKAGTDGQVLTFDASGNPAYIGPGSDGQVLTSSGAGEPPVFETPSPAVGGATGVDFNDTVNVRFGTDNDMQIKHSGTDASIANNTGNLYIQTADSTITMQLNNGEKLVKAIADGGVELYHNNVKKFETLAGGAKVDGELEITSHLEMGDGDIIKIGDGDDLQIHHTGGDYSYIKDSSGRLYARSDRVYIQNAAGGENLLYAEADDGVYLYFNNSTKLQTTNVGVSVTGSVTPSSGIYLGGAGGGNHLDDYEEGTWTPSMDGLSNTPSFYNLTGKYTKIGNVVKCQGFIQIGATKPTFTTLTDVFKVSGLPFAVNAVGYNACIGNVMWQQIDWVGASRSTYGQSDDTQLTAGIVNSTKTEFATCGQSKYYMGRLFNKVFGEGDGWILEWDMTYWTDA